MATFLPNHSDHQGTIKAFLIVLSPSLGHKKDPIRSQPRSKQLIYDSSQGNFLDTHHG